MSTLATVSVYDGLEYAWEIATLYPAQGGWRESEYLDLTDHENRLIEFTDGHVEFLPYGTDRHECLTSYLFRALYTIEESKHLGKVHFHGIRVRLRPNKIRMPDVLFLHKDNFHKRHDRVWDGIDLAMEVVSDYPQFRQRDYIAKLADYAEAGIAEYWIVDYERRRVIVHRLDGKRYVVHGEFAPGEQATSVLLEGFSIDVAALFAAAADVPE